MRFFVSNQNKTGTNISRSYNQWIVHNVCIDYLLFIVLSSQSKTLSLSLLLSLLNGYQRYFRYHLELLKFTHTLVWEFRNWGSVCRRFAQCDTHNRCVHWLYRIHYTCAPLIFYHILTVGWQHCRLYANTRFLVRSYLHIIFWNCVSVGMLGLFLKKCSDSFAVPKKPNTFFVHSYAGNEPKTPTLFILAYNSNGQKSTTCIERVYVCVCSVHMSDCQDTHRTNSLNNQILSFFLRTAKLLDKMN